jgi:Uma2 family endonuclease
LTNPLADDVIELAAMSVAPNMLRPPSFPRRRRFTVREFESMGKAGIIDERCELVHGEIIEMPPVGNAHSIALEDLRDVLRAAWSHQRFVRTQATHRFSDDYAPMPDLALLEHRPVPGALIDELPVLVIEVADETLSYDLGVKRLAYARAGVPEYWVADLKRRRILVFRGPDRAAVEAERAYRDELVAQDDQTVSPLAIPSLRIKVGDVLPPAGA